MRDLCSVIEINSGLHGRMLHAKASLPQFAVAAAPDERGTHYLPFVVHMRETAAVATAFILMEQERARTEFWAGEARYREECWGWWNSGRGPIRFKHRTTGHSCSKWSVGNLIATHLHTSSLLYNCVQAVSPWSCRPRKHLLTSGGEATDCNQLQH